MLLYEKVDCIVALPEHAGAPRGEVSCASPREVGKGELRPRERARRDAGGNGTAGDVVGARGIAWGAHGEGIRVGENLSGASDEQVAGRGRTAAESQIVIGKADGDDKTCQACPASTTSTGRKCTCSLACAF